MQCWEKAGKCRLQEDLDGPRSNLSLILHLMNWKTPLIMTQWLVNQIGDDANLGWILKNFQMQWLRVMVVDRDMKRGIELQWQSMLCIEETLGVIYYCILALIALMVLVDVCS
jgi:hypothetical protein